MDTKAEKLEAAAEAVRGEDQVPALENAGKVEDLVAMAQTEEHRQRVNALDNKDIKIPADLSKVNDSTAKELVQAGLIESRDVPGKMYRRKSDRFMARIPNFEFNAFDKARKDEWEEVKLP